MKNWISSGVIIYKHLIMKQVENTAPIEFRVSVAPMMDWTDRHCRYFHRLLSPSAFLYSEMVTTGALLFGDAERYLRFSPQEHPVALQLGGSEPDALRQSAKMGEDFGYDEINLNCGCPSDRVQKGKFGACLMAEPDLVAECVDAMQAHVKIPVTVKCRIGIDDSEDFEFLNTFIEKIKTAGCGTFIVHARKAWLKGLSPKENREVPPLNYDLVAQIKNAHPDLNIEINGGLATLGGIQSVRHLDGAMIGREAYQNPCFLSEIEELLHGRTKPDRFEIARAMIPYIEDQQARFQTPVHSVTRHLTGLFNGLRGARLWRQTLSDAHAAAGPGFILPVLGRIEAMQTGQIAA